MMKKILSLVAVMAIFVVGLVSYGCSGKSEPDLKAEATQMAKQAVKNQLNYPATADFSLLSIKREELGNNKFKIGGTVKAKNAFGVEEELVYVVELKYNSGDPSSFSNWSVLRCGIDKYYGR